MPALCCVEGSKASRALCNATQRSKCWSRRTPWSSCLKPRNRAGLYSTGKVSFLSDIFVALCGLVPFRPTATSCWGLKDTACPEMRISKRSCQKRGSNAPLRYPKLSLLHLCVGTDTLQHKLPHVNTHTNTSRHARARTHTLSPICPQYWCIVHGQCALWQRHLKAAERNTQNGHRSLFLVVVLSIFSSFAFIFGPFCISWRVFASIFSRFVNHSSVFLCLFWSLFFCIYS